MDKYSYINNANGVFIEELYRKYCKDRNSVDQGWARFFEGYEFQNIMGQEGGEYSLNKEVAVVKLINAYRARGHLVANTNPIRPRRKHKADLEISYFQLDEEDMETEFDAGREIMLGRAKLSAILENLKSTYCGSIGAEFRYCRDEELRHWMYKEMEPSNNHPSFSPEERKHILKMIDKAVTFEQFLQRKYVGKKRFSLEGLEALIPSMDALIETGAELGIQEFVMGMPHRGRLNMLVNIFQKSYEEVFSEFEDAIMPESIQGDGDVKYHQGQSADIVTKKKTQSPPGHHAQSFSSRGGGAAGSWKCLR